MKLVCTFLAALSLAAHGFAQADSGRSLNQVRSEMNSGTWPGITLIEARPNAPAAAASAAVAPAVTSAGKPATAVPGAPAATPAPVPAAPVAAAPSLGQRLGSWFGAPAGLPMNEAKRLDSPSVGIALPTASAPASAGAAPPSRPR